MGHVSVDLRLMSSTWAVLSKLTASVFTIAGRTNPVPLDWVLVRKPLSVTTIGAGPHLSINSPFISQ